MLKYDQNHKKTEYRHGSKADVCLLKAQSWLDGATFRALRSFDSWKPSSVSSSRTDGKVRRQGDQLNYHLPPLDGSLCIVFWHWCALILWSFRLYGMLTLKAEGLLPSACVCMYARICVLCYRLEPCGDAAISFFVYLTPQGLLMIVWLLFEASTVKKMTDGSCYNARHSVVTDVCAGWLEKTGLDKGVA